MPIEVKYLDGGKGFIFIASGKATGEELIAANKQVYSRDLSTDSYLYGVVDCDKIEGLNVTTEQLRELATQDLIASRHLPNFIGAIYAKDDLHFALARMWQVYVETSGWDTRVFRVRSDAVSWVKERVLANFGVAVTLE